jgi:hypothetical protein
MAVWLFDDHRAAHQNTTPSKAAGLAAASRAGCTRSETNIARATRRANRRPHDLITAVISSNPRTQ